MVRRVGSGVLERRETITVAAAKAVARTWVIEEATSTPGFAGAVYHGSTAWLPGDAILSPTSDLDLLVVLGGPAPDEKPGKILRDSVVLDVSYLSFDEIRSPELVLGQCHLA